MAQDPHTTVPPVGSLDRVTFLNAARRRRLQPGSRRRLRCLSRGRSDRDADDFVVLCALQELAVEGPERQRVKELHDRALHFTQLDCQFLAQVTNPQAFVNAS